VRVAFRQSAEGVPGPLPKRTQWEKRIVDENCFSSAASHDACHVRKHGKTSERVEPGAWPPARVDPDKKRIRQAARNIKKYLKSLKENQ